MAGSGQGSPGTGRHRAADSFGDLAGGVADLHPELGQFQVVWLLAQAPLQVLGRLGAQPAHAGRLAHVPLGQVGGHPGRLPLPAGQGQEPLEGVGHLAVQVVGLVLPLGAGSQAHPGGEQGWAGAGLGMPGGHLDLAGPVQGVQPQAQSLKGLVHRLQPGFPLVRVVPQEGLPDLPPGLAAAGVDGVQHRLPLGLAASTGRLLSGRGQEARRGVGGGAAVHQVAAKGAPVLDGHGPGDPGALHQVGQVALDERVLAHIRVGGQGAQGDAVLVGGDGPQPVQALQAEEPGVGQAPGGERHHQVGAPRQGPPGPGLPGQGRQGLLQGRRDAHFADGRVASHGCSFAGEGEPFAREARSTPPLDPDAESGPSPDSASAPAASSTASTIFT